MRIIKKYGNRRLYDTLSSGYVNLDEVIGMIRAGETIQVVEAKTDVDLTRHVLLQALMETSDATGLFPPGLLHRIIRYSGTDPMQAMMMKQLSMGMELLDGQLSRMEGQFPWMSGVSRGASPPTSDPSAEPEPAPEPAPEAAPPTPEEDAELAALRAKLAALEGRLKT